MLPCTNDFSDSCNCQIRAATVSGHAESAAAQALLACEFAPDDAYATAVLGLAWRLTGVEDAADAAREAWLNDTASLICISARPHRRASTT